MTSLQYLDYNQLISELLFAKPAVVLVAVWLMLGGCNAVGNWSRWAELNRRPTVYETVALPLSYIGFL